MLPGSRRSWTFGPSIQDDDESQGHGNDEAEPHYIAPRQSSLSISNVGTVTDVDVRNTEDQAGRNVTQTFSSARKNISHGNVLKFDLKSVTGIYSRLCSCGR